MFNKFEIIFEEILQSKKFTKISGNDKTFVVYSNTDFCIDLIFDYRFNEVGINFITNHNHKKIPFIDCLFEVQKDKFRNVIFMMEHYRKSAVDLLLKKGMETNENLIYIATAAITMQENYDKFKELIQKK